jgi:hypothetical protein
VQLESNCNLRLIPWFRTGQYWIRVENDEYFIGIKNTCNLSINAALQPRERYAVHIVVEECNVDEDVCEQGVLKYLKEELKGECSEYCYEDFEEEDDAIDMVIESDDDCMEHSF